MLTDSVPVAAYYMALLAPTIGIKPPMQSVYPGGVYDAENKAVGEVELPDDEHLMQILSQS